MDVETPYKRDSTRIIWGPYQRATRLYARRFDHGSHGDNSMALTKVLARDVCPLRLPGVLTVA